MKIQKVLLNAAYEFYCLKERITHPEGRFDNAQRWYPDKRLACCNGIREPSRSFPYSLMTHCRSAVHVACSYGVERKELMACYKKLLELFTKPELVELLLNSPEEEFDEEEIAGLIVEALI